MKIDLHDHPSFTNGERLVELITQAGRNLDYNNGLLFVTCANDQPNRFERALRVCDTLPPNWNFEYENRILHVYKKNSNIGLHLAKNYEFESIEGHLVIIANCDDRKMTALLKTAKQKRIDQIAEEISELDFYSTKIAAHPFSKYLGIGEDRILTLMEKELLDAIESNALPFICNNRAEACAKKYNIALISATDTYNIKFMCFGGDPSKMGISHIITNNRFELGKDWPIQIKETINNNDFTAVKKKIPLAEFAWLGLPKLLRYLSGYKFLSNE